MRTRSAPIFARILDQHHAAEADAGASRRNGTSSRSSAPSTSILIASIAVMPASGRTVGQRPAAERARAAVGAGRRHRRLIGMRAAAVVVVDQHFDPPSRSASANGTERGFGRSGLAARLNSSRSRMPGCGSIATMRARAPAQAATNSEKRPTLAPISTKAKVPPPLLAIDRRAECAALDQVEQLRREQRVVLAAIAARIKPHAHAPQRGVEPARGEPAHRDAAQQDREPQAEPIGRHARVSAMIAAVEAAGPRLPKGCRVDAGAGSHRAAHRLEVESPRSARTRRSRITASSRASLSARPQRSDGGCHRCSTPVANAPSFRRTPACSSRTADRNLPCPSR